MRKLLLAFLLAISAAPAIAQTNPIPALPDSERRSHYTVTNSQCNCAINFQLYGDGTDFANWITVWVNGVQVSSHDPTFGWSISSASGSLSSIPRPITDAKLTFNQVISGVNNTVDIVGAQRPRRLTEYSENQGVTAHSFNQTFNNVFAELREDWDRTNDVTGRALLTTPGNNMNTLPPPANCINSFLSFGRDGLTPTCSSVTLTLPQIATSTLLGNFSGITATANAQSVPSCASDGVHALTNPSSGGFNCSTITAGGAVNSVSNSDGTLTISPNSGSVVASLNTSHANTWNAAQSFALNDLLLNGSSTGNTILSSGNSSASNFTITVPAATDQLVARATTDTLTNKTFSASSNTLQISGTAITAIAGNTGTVGTTSGTLTNGHCVSIDANHNFIDAGGACTTGGGGGTVSSATAGQFAWYQASGTTVVGSSHWTDNSTFLVATEPLDLTNQAEVTEIANAGTTGTTSAHLAKLTGAPSTAVITVTGDTSGAVGVVVGGAGTTGTAQIATRGQTTCAFDNATTAGDYVTISNNVNGDCKDAGASYPTSGQVLGQVLTTNGAAGTYAVNLFSPGIVSNSAPVSSVSNGDGTLTISPTTGSVVAGLNTGHANTWSGVQTLNSGKLALAGSSSGSTTLNASATASGTITLPATTDTVAVLGLADQTLAGGANVTSFSNGTKSSGTFTVDCGKSPLQTFTNGGSFTLSAPSNDGSCMLEATNNGSAGTITFSGFTVGSNTGASLTTTNGNKFVISIWRIGGTSGFNVFANQ